MVPLNHTRFLSARRVNYSRVVHRLSIIDYQYFFIFQFSIRSFLRRFYQSIIYPNMKFRRSTILFLYEYMDDMVDIIDSTKFLFKKKHWDSIRLYSLVPILKNWNLYNEQFRSVFNESNWNLYYRSDLCSVSVQWTSSKLLLFKKFQFSIRLSIWYFRSVYNFVEYLRIDIKILSVQFHLSVSYTLFHTLYSILYFYSLFSIWNINPMPSSIFIISLNV